LQPVEIT
jgi:serine/threonine protein kinase